MVHLSRDWKENGIVETAKEALTKILQEQRLRAIGQFGHGAREFKANGCEKAFPKSVCFTETPLEHISLLLEEIESRDCHFKPYGIALPKKLGRRLGINPVWYVELDWNFQKIGSSLDKLIKKAGFKNGKFQDSDLLRLLPFIEQMGTIPSPNGTKKEFWWEREWRHVGDILLPEHYIVLCPEEEFDELAKAIDTKQKPAFIDPDWGLERIIAHLAGFAKGDVELL